MKQNQEEMTLTLHNIWQDGLTVAKDCEQQTIVDDANRINMLSQTERLVVQTTWQVQLYTHINICCQHSTMQHNY